MIAFVGGNLVRTDGEVLYLEKRDFHIDQYGAVSWGAGDCSELIDCSAMVVTPSLTNAHLHLGESHLVDSTSRWSSLSEYIAFGEEVHAALAALGEEAWRVIASYTLSESVRCGIGTVCTGRGWEIVAEQGIEGWCGFPLMKSEKLNSFSEDPESQYAEINRTGLDTVKIGVWLHSLYLSTERHLSVARTLMEGGAKFFATHLSETSDTRRMEEERYGELPTKVLIGKGLLGANTLLAHCGYLTPEELELVAAHSATIAVCPISSIRTGGRMVDVKLLEEMGINWCLGTDGLATGGSLHLADQLGTLIQSFPELSLNALFKRITGSAKKVLAIEEIGGVYEGCPSVSLWPSNGRHSMCQWLEWWTSAAPSCSGLWARGLRVEAKMGSLPPVYNWRQILGRLEQGRPAVRN